MIDREKLRARRSRYDKSAKGRARRYRYNHSIKGIARNTRYEYSPKGWDRQQRSRCSRLAREYEILAGRPLC